ncbi:sigma-70 family RNA polymerase sigma factor [Prosthecobacter fusiformis]|nr:sigma-70 family RNA polymerase sigma factor [Prosthecobacter fusiformis]
MSNRDPFLPLFLAAQPDLRAFIGAAVRDPVTREDVFQEVAMILWKKFESYDPSRSFGAWARGVAAKKILEDRRLRARLPETCTPETLEALSRGFAQEEAEASVQDREKALNFCLEILPERSASILEARYYQEQPVEVIALNARISTEALYQVLSRLRKQLRECVQRRLGLPY